MINITFLDNPGSWGSAPAMPDAETVNFTLPTTSPQAGQKRIALVLSPAITGAIDLAVIGDGTPGTPTTDFDGIPIATPGLAKVSTPFALFTGVPKGDAATPGTWYQ